MYYFVYVKNSLGSFTLINIDKTELDVIIEAYKIGSYNFTISGEKYNFRSIQKIKIFENETELSHNFLRTSMKYKKDVDFDIYDEKTYSDFLFARVAKDITSSLIRNIGFGQATKTPKMPESGSTESYISEQSISELKALRSKDFDFSKLVKLCQEVNFNYSHRNFYSVGMLVRTITNHIPPIFGFPNFKEFANKYSGGKSLKGNLTNLEKSMKHIADGFLHEQIRKVEALATLEQIQFRPDLNRLLQEVIIYIKSK